MPPNSLLAVRLGLATAFLLSLSALGFLVPRADNSVVDVLHGFIILSVPLIALAAVIVQSRWKVDYREATQTWTRNEFLARVSSLRDEGDAEGLIEMFAAGKNANQRKLVLGALDRVAKESDDGSVVAFAITVTQTDEKRTVRARACDLLADHAAEGSVNALITALDDEDSGVRLAAARSLGLLGAREAVPPLRAELGPTDSGVQAGFALAEIRDPQSLPAIEVAAAASPSIWHAKMLRKAAEQLRANLGG